MTLPIGYQPRPAVCVRPPAVALPAGAPAAQPKGQQLATAAQAFAGQPYKWGGGHEGAMAKPGAVDASGLVQQAGRQSGINLDGTARDQQQKGRPVSMNELQPGDLLFKGNPATHVGIYMGGDRVLQAAKSGGTVSYTSDTFFQSARRVTE